MRYHMHQFRCYEKIQQSMAEKGGCFWLCLIPRPFFCTPISSFNFFLPARTHYFFWLILQVQNIQRIKGRVAMSPLAPLLVDNVWLAPHVEIGVLLIPVSFDEIWSRSSQVWGVFRLHTESAAVVRNAERLLSRKTLLMQPFRSSHRAVSLGLFSPPSSEPPDAQWIN